MMNLPQDSSAEMEAPATHSQQGMFAKFARGRTQMSKTRSAPDLRDSTANTIRSSSSSGGVNDGAGAGSGKAEAVTTTAAGMTRSGTARVVQKKETQNSIAVLEARLRRENEKLENQEESRQRDKKRRSMGALYGGMLMKAKEEQKEEDESGGDTAAMVAMLMTPDKDGGAGSDEKTKHKLKLMMPHKNADDGNGEPRTPLSAKTKKREKRKSLMADMALKVSKKDKKDKKKDKKDKKEKKEKREKRKEEKRMEKIEKKEEKMEEKRRKRRSTSLSTRKKDPSDLNSYTPNVSSYSLNPAQAAKLLRDANVHPSRAPPASISLGSLGSNASAIAPSSVRFRDDVATAAPERVPVTARGSKKTPARNEETLVGDYMKKMALHELQAYQQSHGDENVLRRAIKNKFLLHVAIEAGHDDVVRFLVDNKKFKLNTPDAMGWTPLHCACDSGRIDIILFLLSKKRTNVQKVTSDGCTALHYLIRHFPDSFDPKYNELLERYSDVANRLVSIGCDINATNRNGETVLHYAAFRGNATAVRYLLSRKDWDLDMNSTTNAGETPLHLACYSGSLDTVNALLEYGAATNIIGINGTPIDIAKRQNDKRLVMALLKHQQKREPSRYRISKADAQYLGYAYSSAGEDGDMEETTEAEFISDVDAEQDTPRSRRVSMQPYRDHNEEEEASLYFGSNKAVVLRQAHEQMAKKTEQGGLHQSSPIKVVAVTRNEDRTPTTNSTALRPIFKSSDDRALLNRDERKQRRKSKGSSSKRTSRGSERTNRRRSLVVTNPQQDELIRLANKHLSSEARHYEGKGKEKIDDDYEADSLRDQKSPRLRAQAISPRWEDEQEPQDHQNEDDVDERSSMKSSGGVERAHETTKRDHADHRTYKDATSDDLLTAKDDDDDESEHIARSTTDKKLPHVLSPGRLRRAISFDDQNKRKKDKVKTSGVEASSSGKVKVRRKKNDAASQDEGSQRRSRRTKKSALNDGERGSSKKERGGSKKTKKSAFSKNAEEEGKIRAWLEELNLPSEYLELLLKDGFDDMATIQLITEEDLAEIGIAKTGHRKRIMRWVRQNPASPIYSPRLVHAPVESGLYQQVDGSDVQFQEAMMMATHSTGPVTALPSHPAGFSFAPYSPYAFVSGRSGDIGSFAYMHSPHSISIESPKERMNREAKERIKRRNSLTTPIYSGSINREMSSPIGSFSSPELKDSELPNVASIRRKNVKSISGEVPIRLYKERDSMNAQEEDARERERRLYTVSPTASPRKVTIAATPALMLAGNRSAKSPRQREPHQVYVKTNIQPTSGSPLSPRKHQITPIPIPSTNHFLASSAMSPVDSTFSPSSTSSSAASSASLSPILSPRLPAFSRKPLPRPPQRPQAEGLTISSSPRDRGAWY